MKKIQEFLIRSKMFIFILSLYSFIISYYAFDLLEFIILSLSKKFSLDLMLTQLEDLTIIIFDLVNYSLLVLIIPFLFIPFYYYYHTLKLVFSV